MGMYGKTHMKKKNVRTGEMPMTSKYVIYGIGYLQ